MKSQTGQQMITIQIFPNISRSKSNQTKKFRQLRKYGMMNIFLKKSYKIIKWGGEASPRGFNEKSKLSIYICINSIYLFFLYVQVEIYQNILKLRCWPIVFILYKAFLKNKKRAGTSLPARFSIWFVKRNISHVVFY